MTTTLAPPVTVRAATTADLETLVEMGRRFLQTTQYRDRIADDPAHVRRLADLILHAGRHGRIVVAERDGALVGMIWGLLIVHPLLNIALGTEVVWWVEPAARGSGAGRALFTALEAWAQAEGAVAMQFTAYRDEQLERVYRRYGYVPQEIVFEKRFPDAHP